MAASYPTSAKTFTTKSNGDTIQPGHVNDLQDEVAAIEAGLLNGTAPLNSSNSTLANLSVPGASTLASLQVSGNSTITGTLTVNKIISTSIGAGVQSFVVAYLGSTWHAPSSAANQVVALGERLIDVGGEYDSTTYTFTPKSTGVYLLTARVLIPPISSGGGARIAITVNSSAVAEAQYFIGGGANPAQTLNAQAVRSLSSGAAGAVKLTIHTPTSSSVGLSTGSAACGMEIIKLF